MTLLILIPCKNFDHGKSRLAPDLDSDSRRALCEQFLRQTLGLAMSIVPPRQVNVLTDDPRAALIGADCGASTLPDAGGGLNSALEEAKRLLLPDYSCKPDMLVLPTDLPYATSAAISAVVACAADVVIVPDRERQGTNLLCLKAQVLKNFSFAFGPDSFPRHCAAASTAGYSVQVVSDELLAFDVDQPRHYLQWRGELSR
jgi:2-phospho-L-lactate guanylyltransferase